jgi:DNA-binding transcriptional ArsR family regulator
MSNKSATKSLQQACAAAEVFAALGDPTRLALVNQLCDGSTRSISQLTEGTNLSRQGITKHLRVLQDAGLVRNEKSGRESLFAYNPRPIHNARSYIDVVSRQWDQSLGRLKSFIEDDRNR